MRIRNLECKMLTQHLDGAGAGWGGINWGILIRRVATLIIGEIIEKIKLIGARQ